METKQVFCRFSASFDVVLTVPVNATPEEIGEELSNVDIPENSTCKYHLDTFNPETDEFGNPQLYNADGTEVGT